MKCTKCGGSGVVKIWHPKAVKAVLETSDQWDVTDCGVACTCSQGDVVKAAFDARMERRSKPGRLDRLGDCWWHCQVTVRTRAENNSRGLVPRGPWKGQWHFWRPDWDVEDQEVRRPNYTGEFDQWNDR